MANHRAHHVGRHCKTNPVATTVTADNGCIDANQASLQVYQGAAGVAHINSGVGLNKILIIIGVEAVPAQGADYAGGDSLANAERVADGDYKVSDMHAVYISQFNLHQILSLNLQQSHVGIGIAAYQLRFQHTAVIKLHRDIGSIIDDVMISDNESGFTINYDTGPCPHGEGLAPLRARDVLKVLAQFLRDAITLEKILIRCWNCLGHPDIHHRRCDGFQHRGKGWNPLLKSFQAHGRRHAAA